MNGLAEALGDPVISEYLVRGQAQLMLVQWTGSSRQEASIPWTTIDSFATLEGFAAQIVQTRRVWRNYATAVGEALEFSLDALGEVGHCKRRLIDVSGDGVSNEGLEPRETHARVRAEGVTVNAIAIEESDPGLTVYFFENVIMGEGAFVVSAAGFLDYPEKIRKKLLREVAEQVSLLDSDL